MTSKSEINMLIQQTIMSRFDLSFLDQFIEYQSRNKEDLRLQNESSLWIARIYFHNNFLNEALEIYLRIIKEEDIITSPDFFNVIFESILLLTQLNRLEEALLIFEANIHNEALKSFNEIIPLLAWYVESCSPTNTDLVRFKPLLNKAIDDLGFISSESGLKQKILEAGKTNKMAARKYGEILLSTEGKLIVDKIVILEEFIAANPPGFYKNLAQDFIIELKK